MGAYERGRQKAYSVGNAENYTASSTLNVGTNCIGFRSKDTSGTLSFTLADDPSETVFSVTLADYETVPYRLATVESGTTVDGLVLYQ